MEAVLIRRTAFFYKQIGKRSTRYHEMKRARIHGKIITKVDVIVGLNGKEAKRNNTHEETQGIRPFGSMLIPASCCCPDSAYAPVFSDRFFC